MNDSVRNDLVSRISDATRHVIGVASCSIEGTIFATAIETFVSISEAILDLIYSWWIEIKNFFIPETIDLEDVKVHPERHMKKIFENGLPSFISFTNTEAVDAGGLFKNYIRTLIEAVSSSAGFCRTQEGLLVMFDDESLLKIQQIGRLYALVNEKNENVRESKKILLGNFLHPDFLELVRIVNLDFSGDEKFLQVANFLQKKGCRFLKLTAELFFNPTEKKIEEYVVNFGVSQEDALDDARERINAYILATQAFYEGTTPSFKEKILMQEPKSLLESIQGPKITKKIVKDAIRLGSFVNRENAILKLQWIMSKIDSLQQDDPWLVNFVKTITNLSTLAPGMKLVFNEKGNQFFAHTCFNEMDFPAGYISRELFIAGIESCFESSGLSYNTI